MFARLLNDLRSEVTKKLATVRPMTEEERQSLLQQIVRQQEAAAIARDATAAPSPAAKAGTPRPGFDEADVATWGNPGRNDDCPCGSGLKFKHCHGKLA